MQVHINAVKLSALHKLSLSYSILALILKHNKIYKQGVPKKVLYKEALRSI